MNNFKVGDEVIVLRVDEFAGPAELNMVGKVGIISDVLSDGQPYPYKLKGDICFSERELELLSVYNSPFYQALR
jgi:hypothetical protein